MLFKRRGFPEEGEIVLCTVTRVDKHSVFVTLNEYSYNGLIHISEISPGRIRNIRDFVIEGRQVVCKVLNVDEAKGQIDLSLRRVNLAQKKEKLSQVKQEQTAEKILEFVADKLKKDKLELYKEVSQKVLKKYNSLFEFFHAVVNSEASFDEMDVDKTVSKALNDAVKLRMKPTQVEARAMLSLESFAPDGVNIVKKAIKKSMETNKNVKITYLGSGRYNVAVSARNYKEADGIIEEALSQAIACIKSDGGNGSFKK